MNLSAGILVEFLYVFKVVKIKKSTCYDATYNLCRILKLPTGISLKSFFSREKLKYERKQATFQLEFFAYHELNTEDKTIRRNESQFLPLRGLGLYQDGRLKMLQRLAKTTRDQLCHLVTFG